MVAGGVRKRPAGPMNEGICEMPRPPSVSYTVYRPEDSSDPQRGLTLEQAADALLTADGYEYEIREDTGLRPGWTLFISRRSRNAFGGGRGLLQSRFFSLEPDYATAAAEIYRAVITDTWHGQEAMTDADFDEMKARAAADDVDD